MYKERLWLQVEGAHKYIDRTPIDTKSSKGPELAMQLATKKAIGALWSKNLRN